MTSGTGSDAANESAGRDVGASGSDSPVVIVGAGPAGAAAAYFIASQGIDVVLVEKHDFPRFHIGEALTGSAGKLLRRMGLADRLDEQGHSVKNGAVIYGKGGNNSFFVPAVDVTQQGERVDTTTYQVRRDLFDSALLDHAVEHGARLVRGEATEVLHAADGAVTGVVVQTADGPIKLHSKLLIDASGLGCFLHHHGLTSEKRRGAYHAQIAVYNHLYGTTRKAGIGLDDNTVLLYREPLEWAWFIPTTADITSVGVVVPTAYYKEKKEDLDTFFWRELRELNPQLENRTVGAEAAERTRAARSFSYQIDEFAGPGWVCLADAHRFIDPFFAFGIHFALFEAQKIADYVPEYLETGDQRLLESFMSWSDAGMEIAQDLIDGFWNRPLGFGYIYQHKRYRDDIIDIFAGRLYDVEEPSVGLQQLRKLRAAQPSIV